MKVFSRGDPLNWPTLCACCGDAAADTVVAIGSTIVQYKGNQKFSHYSSWPVPVCETCKVHHKALIQKRGLNALLAIVIAICLVAVIFVDAQAVKRAAGAILLVAAIAWIWRRSGSTNLRSLLGPNCSDLCFIGYTHKPESVPGYGKVHWFNFANREFALKFAQMNNGTLMSESEFERDKEQGYEDTVGVTLPRRDLHF